MAKHKFTPTYYRATLRCDPNDEVGRAAFLAMQRAGVDFQQTEDGYTAEVTTDDHDAILEDMCRNHRDGLGESWSLTLA